MIGGNEIFGIGGRRFMRVARRSCYNDKLWLYEELSRDKDHIDSSLQKPVYTICPISRFRCTSDPKQWACWSFVVI